MSLNLFEYKETGSFISKEELSARGQQSDKSLANFLAKYTKVARDDKQSSELPRGLKADVWQVKDKSTVRSYVMKVIEKQPKHKPFLAYMRQVEIQRRISHPNFIRIVDFFEDLSNVYIVSECTLLGNLSSVIVSKKQLNEREACLCLVQICSILNFMHKNGLVHRDIKPANILVCKNFTLKLPLTLCAELAKKTGKL
eukprot:TRINITY_DN12145_c0_g5_i4.p2 TRINITY_DN12145_c0_g5~~TRINITY_DN12145_c0_g5_i4.p2  ORF type:complete len:198 (-),score=21.60 TRINITY_DN12145_c0_g5_i4:290-883(-)